MAIRAPDGANKKTEMGGVRVEPNTGGGFGSYKKEMALKIKMEQSLGGSLITSWAGRAGEGDREWLPTRLGGTHPYLHDQQHHHHQGEEGSFIY